MQSGNIDTSTSNGGPAGSRWNPTKEQIDFLENLYKQGIRTPSAEQIQQITSKLKAFGNIEGKNVFYWFQNHKARQRQKQKQESIAHFNRFLHRVPPPYPTWPNACGPYYMQPNELAYKPNYPKVILPGCYKRRPTTLENTTTFNGVFQDPRYHQAHNIISSYGKEEEFLINSNNQFTRETLDLFPVHPSGNLQAKKGNFSIASTSYCETSIAGSSTSDDNYMTEKGNNLGKHQLIDFFCGNGPCDSH